MMQSTVKPVQRCQRHDKALHVTSLGLIFAIEIISFGRIKSLKIRIFRNYWNLCICSLQMNLLKLVRIDGSIEQTGLIRNYYFYFLLDFVSVSVFILITTYSLIVISINIWFQFICTSCTYRWVFFFYKYCFYRHDVLFLNQILNLFKTLFYWHDLLIFYEYFIRVAKVSEDFIRMQDLNFNPMQHFYFFVKFYSIILFLCEIGYSYVLDFLYGTDRQVIKRRY